MKKIFITLIVIIIIFWGIWLIFPRNSLHSIIEKSISAKDFNADISGFKKGLFYNLHIDNIILKNSGKEVISLDNTHCRINPLFLIILRLNLSLDGNVAGGDFSGRANLSRNSTDIELGVKDANIINIPLLRLINIKGAGTISGRFVLNDDEGHAEFVSEDMNLEPASFSGFILPLNFFHVIRGSLDVKGNMISIASIALEGKDIYARLKGTIRNKSADLNMELMPGKSFIENPLFISGFKRYEVSPGYYVIPVRGDLFKPV
ncbi:MAG: type II secretion system protein GspN [Nitrospirota bacterium]